MAPIKKSKLYCDYSTERLIDCIRRGKRVVTIQALLQVGVDINARDSEGNTPLLIACLKDRVTIVDLLIKSGANVEVKYSRDLTVLHYASMNGSIEMVRALVKRVPDLDARDIRGETALHHASRSGCLEVVQCLLEGGADMDMKSYEDFTPLLCAAQVSWKNAVDLLLRYWANIDGCKEMLLYYTARNRWTRLVHFLVKRVPKVNLNECVFGETFLHAASTKGHLEVVKCLLEGGADINKRNDGGPQSGETALHPASRNGHLEIVKCLVEKGADINVKNNNGATPVLLAGDHYHKDVVDLLMHCGANVDATNLEKCTLLHFASFNGWLDVVKSIVKQNFDLDAKSCGGVTALYAACLTKQFDIAQYLLQVGAGWDIEEKTNISPLSCAIMVEPDFKIIKLLIENGAYLKSVHYEAIVESFQLKLLLQDVEFCCQAIMNKFNNDLTELYKLPASRSLPCIEQMTIASGREVAQTIRQNVIFEMQTKGHCNILEVRPIALSIFSVRSLLSYCEKKNQHCKIV